MATKKGDIFTITLPETLAPTDQFTRRLFIDRPQRKIQVKRIKHDITITDITTGLIVPWKENHYIGFSLYLMSENNNDTIASLFRPVGFIPVPGVNNGKSLYLFNPGQYLYDNLYFKNLIEVNYTVHNHIGLNTYSIMSAITIETEQSIIY